MDPIIRLGMLTPSSNTVVEPVTAAMLTGMPHVTAHFARFSVLRIALSAQAIRQFDHAEIGRAARSLVEAKVHVLAWNGTSAGWLGFDADERLCATLRDTTGTPACTSVLALNELFALKGVRRFGLVTPYNDEVQQAIIANYQAAGYSCVAERHLGLEDNFSFAQVPSERLQQMILEVAAAKPDAITTFCTNLRAAPLAEALEAQIGIPIFDTVATALWKSLRVAGVDAREVRGWGSLFRDFN
jgi:maleate isomerase